MKKVSIVIVNYQVREELFACLQSIEKTRGNIAYEVIVIDNDNGSLEKELKKKYPYARYKKTSKNIGFGAGNNIGAEMAKGSYLFFLNPDTTITSNTITSLVTFLEDHKDAGVVAPLLHGNDNKPYQQGTQMLTPLRAIMSLSFVHKLIPNNNVAKKYWLREWDMKIAKEVDVVPGTAFLIRKDVFQKVGSFDKKFFLFFEEFDLCNRVKQEGWKLYITPKTIVKHIWGASTRKSDTKAIFMRSRFYYFKKHFGWPAALMTEAFLRFNKQVTLVLSIALIGFLLRVNRLSYNMPFIGDQGWFYLSARDLVLDGNIPLVGITSSHTWLHQGALWTYMLAPVLWLSNFNPLAGAYLTSGLDIVTVVILYIFGRAFFTQRVGIFAACMYATSPFAVYASRMPYHTAPIPLLMIAYLYLVFRWVSGKSSVFPWIIAVLALLYNFELAAFVVTGSTLILFLYGIFKKHAWAKGILNRNVLSWSIIAFVIPMLPMLLYDLSHYFVQTVGIMVWVGYKVLVLFGFPALGQSEPFSLEKMLLYMRSFFVRLLFPENAFVAGGLFISSFIFVLTNGKKWRLHQHIVLLCYIQLFLIIGIFVSKTPSEAYLPLLFPGTILFIAILLDHVCRWKVGTYAAYLGILVLMIGNTRFLIDRDYEFNTNSLSTSFAKRIAMANYIVKEANGKAYTIVGRGEGSQFVSYTMGYEYLTWWLGHGPTKDNYKMRFVIQESSKGIHVTVEDNI